MAAAPLCSLRDLHSDRRDLYAGVCPIAGPRVRDVVAGRRLERGRGRDRAETVFPGPLRPDIGRSLSRDGLERIDRLRRRAVVVAATCAMVHHRRGFALQFRGYFSRMAAASFSERDLALFRAVGRGLSLY